MATPSLVRSAAVLLGAVIGSSCHRAEPQEVLTVEEVVPRIDELDGRMVSVAGYLPKCSGYTCLLLRNKEDADDWHRAMAAVYANEPFEKPDFPELAIGMAANFDAKAAPLTNSYVVITGTITNGCRFEGKPACLDRGADLEPLAIRAATPPAS